MDFTHRTTRNIGSIKAGTPIRVEQFFTYQDFGDVLAKLGDNPNISYKRVVGGHVLFQDESLDGPVFVNNGDYIITDGTRFWATEVDTVFEPLPKKDTPMYFEKRFDLGVNDGNIIIDGENNPGEYALGTYRGIYPNYVYISAAELHQLADFIKENVPEPSPIEGHLFIWGTPKSGFPREPLVRDGEFWYDSAGVAYSTEDVHNLYTDLVVIR